MQYVRYMTHDKIIGYGILEEGQIRELSGSFFETSERTGISLQLDDVHLLTPCIPGKIFCIGLNYPDHIKELGLKTPERPAGFLKPSSSVIHPGEAIEIPPAAQQVDYEGEVAIVIKDRFKNASPDEARQHILGVTPLNDVTERLISQTPQLVTYSKAFDTFTSFGPVIDTDIDPDRAIVRTYLNGKKVQEGCTCDTLFRPSELVSFLSQAMTFYPGDLISTGTPVNVLALSDHDRVEIEIEGISLRLVNPVCDLRTTGR
ncbi:MAG: fumarylacetoacetate hydrolase family protein [Eubacteriales bacterium]|nr:fumarylacetoacetate hydrolase family protein [Eubacteriales bacterium]